MNRRLRTSRTTGHAMQLPVLERRLENGLKALVLRVPGAPLVVVDVFYPVGSYDEPPGLSGLAHFVEHMLFKGTEGFPKGEIDRLIMEAAGHCNAETGEDSTHYWSTLPANRWELALEIEADRMYRARFDPREVELERRVIGEERARDLGAPQGRLDQNYMAVSYLRHPYRNPILGWPEDAARITVDDLTRFYQRHYRPDGAVVVVVGAVRPDRVLDRIASIFARVPRGGEPARPPSVVEPAQTGRRDFDVIEPGGLPRAVFGWRTVPRGHRDVAALDVLSDLLTCGRRSRLWSRLVEMAGLATWVEASHATSRRGGQLLIQVEADPDASRGAIEILIHDALERLAESGPTPEEMERSRCRLDSAWRWERDDPAILASGLGNAALWDDWRSWPAEHAAAIAVTAQQVRRVAATYLIDRSLTVGWSMPDPDSALAPAVGSIPGEVACESRATGTRRRGRGSASVVDAPEAPSASPVASLTPFRVSRVADYHPRRTVLDNGLRVVLERRAGTGVIALELHVDAGLVREEKPGLAALTGRLLEEGTTTRSPDAIASEVEDVGGTLEVGSTGVSMRVRAEDLERAIDLLADLVLRPAFPVEALARLRRRMAAEMQGDLDDPSFRADLGFRGLIYGTHPLGRDPRGTPRDLARLSRDDVIEHHRRHFVPEGGILALAGDFDTRRVDRLVARALSDWMRQAPSRPPLPPVAQSVRPRVRRIPHPGDQVHLLIGHLGVSRNHPDYDALLVLDHVFGSGPGFSDRLGRILRDEMGLVYAIGGGITDSADILPGMFRVYAGMKPEECDRVVATVTEQVRAMRDGLFSDEEVDRARRYIAGSWVYEFQGVEQRVERLLDLERWGRPLDEPRTWPDRIAAVTPEQVRQAARTHLWPDSLSRVEVGPARRSGQRSRAERA